jgi:tRNA acetyltransferase TAN1
MKRPFTALTTHLLKRLNFCETPQAVVQTVLKEFNLLATTYRGNEGYARSELRYLLKQVGDEIPVVDRTGISGLIVAKTALDPFDAIGKFREILRDRPYEFRYMLRVIPIERVVHTSLEQIQDAVKLLSPKIAEGETFRVTVEKRFTQTHSKDIIEAAAARIKRKVNLTKPDRVLLVEVVGGLTGVSVTRPDEILSVLKEKVL